MNGQFAIAFAAGMVAAFNPCGFAMLPAYLSYFLGLEGDADDQSTAGAILRAISVGATVTLGFAMVFLLVGIALEAVSSSFQEYLPYITMVMGLGVVVLGVAMLRGFRPVVSLPKLDKGGRTREFGSMLLFGISYAIASISCTIPIFTVQVINTFRTESYASGLLAYLLYALGMGLVLMTLTLAIALAREGVVRRMRGALRYIDRVAGGFLVVAGLFLAYYGYWEVRVLDTGRDIGGPASLLTDWNDSVRQWIVDVGPTRLGLVLGGSLVVAVVLSIGWRQYRRSGTG